MSDQIIGALLQLGHHFSPKIIRVAGYLGRKEMEELLAPLRSDPKRLEPYGLKVFSQADEDGILQEIFSRLGISQGVALEIGVETGLENNSHLLLYKGWQTYWVESDESRSQVIREKFADVLASGQLKFRQSFVTVENLRETLSEVPSDLDFVSIDVDGNDYYLLEALNLQPKVICVEYNSRFPPGISWAQTYNPNHVWCGSSYFGASLTALWRLAQRLGYTLVGTNIVGNNAFFVRNELAQDKFSIPATPEALYNPPRYWLIHDVFVHCGHSSDRGPSIEVP